MPSPGQVAMLVTDGGTEGLGGCSQGSRHCLLNHAQSHSCGFVAGQQTQGDDGD